MSELLVSALSLSEQVALELHMADKTMANVRALFAAFEPPVEPATPSCLAPSRPAGGSILFPTAEHTAMVQENVKFIPLRVCTCIRHARMYRTRGDGKSLYFAECFPCGIQTPRLPTIEEAADAWNKSDVQPIQHRRTTAVAA